jgi:hypothetical protein
MTTTLAVRLRRAIAPIAVVALSLTPLTAGSVSASATATATAAEEAPAARTVSDLVPVVASLGNHADLIGARVEALDAKGKVLQRVVTGERGGAHLSRAKVAKAVMLRVTGGTSEMGTVNNATLYGKIRLHPQRIQVQYVTPVTTLASMVAEKRNRSYAAGMRAVRDHLKIPHWTREWQHSSVVHLFDASEFRDFVTKRGGVRQALASLERSILKGAKPRSFGIEGPQPRGAASFAGELLFTAVIEASTGESPDQLIGTLTGTQDPTAAALASIESELVQIAAMLTTIEADMQEMLSQIAVTQYDTIAQSLSTAVDNTQNQWVNYNYLVNHVDPSDRVTYQEYAEDFYDDISPTIAQFNSLFTTAGSTGLLDELYQMNAVEYPWWNASDITNMQSTVDYYGTMQAQAVTLLSEAWNFSSPTYTHNKTKSYISGQLNGLYGVQSANIYKTAPESLNAGEIVNPANRRAYKLAPFTQPNAVYQQVTSFNGCSSAMNAGKYYNTPIVSASTISGWWTSATPSGYTSAASSEMTFLGTQRKSTSNGTTTSTNALPAMTVNAPSAWLMVSNQGQPLLNLMNTTGTSSMPFYYGWMYCNNSSVSLVSSQLQKFVMNALMLQGNSYVPSGQGLNSSSTIPVALLVSRSGQFSYVAPTG